MSRTLLARRDDSNSVEKIHGGITGCFETFFYLKFNAQDICLSTRSSFVRLRRRWGEETPSVAPKNPSVQAPSEAATEDAPIPSDPVISLSPTAPYDDLSSDLPSLTTPSTTASTFCGYTGGGSRITGTVSKVHDGDTITVAGYSIRLDSIDAPELKQAYGVQSRDNLANLVNGQPVTVTYAKKDKYGRIVGTVFKSDCTQVNLRQVETGSAW